MDRQIVSQVRRLDAIEQRLDRRIDELEARLYRRIGYLDARVDRIIDHTNIPSARLAATPPVTATD
jgi:hypothetical protein